MNKPNTQVASCETTHTPGPWSISGVPGDNYVMAADGRNRVSVCQLMGWPGITPEELHANKHLIRSAPELLAALKAIEPRLDRAGRGELQCGPKGKDCDWDSVKATIREAIANAEGSMMWCATQKAGAK